MRQPTYYRRVSSRVYADAYFRSLETPHAALLYLYLLTSPLQTQLGAFRGHPAALADDLPGMTPEEVDELLAQFEADGVIARGDQSWIAVLVMPAHAATRPNGDHRNSWRANPACVPGALLTKLLAEWEVAYQSAAKVASAPRGRRRTRETVHSALTRDRERSFAADCYPSGTVGAGSGAESAPESGAEYGATGKGRGKRKRRERGKGTGSPPSSQRKEEDRPATGADPQELGDRLKNALGADFGLGKAADAEANLTELAHHISIVAGATGLSRDEVLASVIAQAQGHMSKPAFSPPFWLRNLLAPAMYDRLLTDRGLWLVGDGLDTRVITQAQMAEEPESQKTGASEDSGTPDVRVSEPEIETTEESEMLKPKPIELTEEESQAYLDAQLQADEDQANAADIAREEQAEERRKKRERMLADLKKDEK